MYTGNRLFNHSIRIHIIFKFCVNKHQKDSNYSSSIFAHYQICRQSFPHSLDIRLLFFLNLVRWIFHKYLFGRTLEITSPYTWLWSCFKISSITVKSSTAGGRADTVARNCRYRGNCLIVALVPPWSFFVRLLLLAWTVELWALSATSSSSLRIVDKFVDE